MIGASLSRSSLVRRELRTSLRLLVFLLPMIAVGSAGAQAVAVGDGVEDVVTGEASTNGAGPAGIVPFTKGFKRVAGDEFAT